MFAFVLEIIFYVNIPSALLIYNLTVMMSLENLSFIHQRVLNAKGKISTAKILRFRIIATILIFGLGFIPMNEYFIIILSGSLLGPMIFFIIPVRNINVYFKALGWGEYRFWIEINRFWLIKVNKNGNIKEPNYS